MPKDITLGPIKLSSEVIVMLVVMVLSSVWNLVYAVGIGLIMASLMFMKKIGDITAKRSNVTSLSEEIWPDEKEIPKKLRDEVFIKHINGPLFFGSTNEFQELSDQIPKNATIVIIRMGRMPYMDQSGLYAMEEVLHALKRKQITVLLVKILEQPKYMMQKIDLVPGLIPNEHVFDNFKLCMNWLGSHEERLDT